MYSSDTTTEDSERTAFRKAEKIYKLYYDHNAKSSKKYDLESPILISFFGCSQLLIIGLFFVFIQEKATEISRFIRGFGFQVNS